MAHTPALPHQQKSRRQKLLVALLSTAGLCSFHCTDLITHAVAPVPSGSPVQVAGKMPAPALEPAALYLNALHTQRDPVPVHSPKGALAAIITAYSPTHVKIEAKLPLILHGLEALRQVAITSEHPLLLADSLQLTAPCTIQTPALIVGSTLHIARLRPHTLRTPLLQVLEAGHLELGLQDLPATTALPDLINNGTTTFEMAATQELSLQFNQLHNRGGFFINTTTETEAAKADGREDSSNSNQLTIMCKNDFTQEGHVFSQKALHLISPNDAMMWVNHGIMRAPSMRLSGLARNKGVLMAWSEEQRGEGVLDISLTAPRVAAMPAQKDVLFMVSHPGAFISQRRFRLKTRGPQQGLHTFSLEGMVISGGETEIDLQGGTSRYLVIGTPGAAPSDLKQVGAFLWHMHQSSDTASAYLFNHVAPHGAFISKGRMHVHSIAEAPLQLVNYGRFHHLQDSPFLYTSGITNGGIWVERGTLTVPNGENASLRFMKGAITHLEKIEALGSNGRPGLRLLSPKGHITIGEDLSFSAHQKPGFEVYKPTDEAGSFTLHVGALHVKMHRPCLSMPLHANNGIHVSFRSLKGVEEEAVRSILAPLTSLWGRVTVKATGPVTLGASALLQSEKKNVVIETFGLKVENGAKILSPKTISVNAGDNAVTSFKNNGFMAAGENIYVLAANAKKHKGIFQTNRLQFTFSRFNAKDFQLGTVQANKISVLSKGQTVIDKTLSMQQPFRLWGMGDVEQTRPVQAPGVEMRAGGSMHSYASVLSKADLTLSARSQVLGGQRYVGMRAHISSGDYTDIWGSSTLVSPSVSTHSAGRLHTRGTVVAHHWESKAKHMTIASGGSQHRTVSFFTFEGDHLTVAAPQDVGQAFVAKSKKSIELGADLKSGGAIDLSTAHLTTAPATTIEAKQFVAIEAKKTFKLLKTKLKAPTIYIEGGLENPLVESTFDGVMLHGETAQFKTGNAVIKATTFDLTNMLSWSAADLTVIGSLFRTKKLHLTGQGALKLTDTLSHCTDEQFMSFKTASGAKVNFKGGSISLISDLRTELDAVFETSQHTHVVVKNGSLQGHMDIKAKSVLLEARGEANLKGTITSEQARIKTGNHLRANLTFKNGLVELESGGRMEAATVLDHLKQFVAKSKGAMVVRTDGTSKTAFFEADDTADIKSFLKEVEYLKASGAKDMTMQFDLQAAAADIKARGDLSLSGRAKMTETLSAAAGRDLRNAASTEAKAHAFEAGGTYGHDGYTASSDATFIQAEKVRDLEDHLRYRKGLDTHSLLSIDTAQGYTLTGEYHHGFSLRGTTIEVEEDLTFHHDVSVESRKKTTFHGPISSAHHLHFIAEEFGFENTNPAAATDYLHSDKTLSLKQKRGDLVLPTINISGDQGVQLEAEQGNLVLEAKHDQSREAYDLSHVTSKAGKIGLNADRQVQLQGAHIEGESGVNICGKTGVVATTPSTYHTRSGSCWFIIGTYSWRKEWTTFYRPTVESKGDVNIVSEMGGVSLEGIDGTKVGGNFNISALNDVLFKAAKGRNYSRSSTSVLIFINSASSNSYDTSACPSTFSEKKLNVKARRGKIEGEGYTGRGKEGASFYGNQGVFLKPLISKEEQSSQKFGFYGEISNHTASLGFGVKTRLSKVQREMLNAINSENGDVTFATGKEGQVDVAANIKAKRLILNTPKATFLGAKTSTESKSEGFSVASVSFRPDRFICGLKAKVGSYKNGQSQETRYTKAALEVEEVVAKQKVDIHLAGAKVKATKASGEPIHLTQTDPTDTYRKQKISGSLVGLSTDIQVDLLAGRATTTDRYAPSKTTTHHLPPSTPGLTVEALETNPSFWRKDTVGAGLLSVGTKSNLAPGTAAATGAPLPWWALLLGLDVPGHIQEELDRINDVATGLMPDDHPWICLPYKEYEATLGTGRKKQFQTVSELAHDHDAITKSAYLADMAYRGSEHWHKIERSTGWEVSSAGYFGSYGAGGITATFEAEGDLGLVNFVSFVGTNGVDEWCKYLNKSRLDLVNVAGIDPKMPFRIQGGVNFNFCENYLASGYSDRLAAKQETPTIYVGHSRGGAVADIATLHAGTKWSDFSMIGSITFGQPAVFSESIEMYLTPYQLNRVKLSHVRDVVFGSFNNSVSNSMRYRLGGSLRMLPYQGEGITPETLYKIRNFVRAAPYLKTFIRPIFSLMGSKEEVFDNHLMKAYIATLEPKAV